MMRIHDDHSLLQEAKAFTDAYCSTNDIAQRELACLKVQFPAIFLPIGPEDLFVGYTRMPLVGYRYSWSGGAGWIGYHCDHNALDRLAANEALTQEDRALAAELNGFWKENTTRAKLRKEYPIINERVIPGFAEVFTRLAEINLNFDLLLQEGIPGLKKKVQALNAVNPLPLYEAELGAFGLIEEMLHAYAEEARSLMANVNEQRRAELARMAVTLDGLTVKAPDSFYSALSLFHLIAMMTTVDNFARMDVYMGDFLVSDLEKGVLTREEALRILVNMYARFDQLFSTTGRIIIGGHGRRNEKNADQMAPLLMDAAQTVHGTAPTLSMRVYKDLNPALWEKAMDTLEAGCSYPLLFNDEVNVPCRMKAMRVPREDAEQYIMSNCGEYGLWGRSIHSPNGSINYIKILELVLHNGVDPLTGEKIGLETGDPTQFESVEEIWQAFKKQSSYFIERISDCLPPIYEMAARESNNLLMTPLYADCLERGEGLLNGARYTFCDIETHSVVLTADSLTAIDHVVFKDRRFGMDRLIAALDADFEGYELERSYLLHAPKFGNDNEQADAMTRMVSDFIYEETARQADRLGVHAFTASQITVDGYIVYGKYTGATPNGRKAGEPITNSINPANGCDREGVIALLHSMAGVDPSLTGGQVHHLKLSPAAFRADRRAATSGMIRNFFAEGGGELSVYTVRQEDLLDAMEHPEKHPNLIVRIGGYNARFIAVSRELQQEMVSRSAYIG